MNKKSLPILLFLLVSILSLGWFGYSEYQDQDFSPTLQLEKNLEDENIVYLRSQKFNFGFNISKDLMGQDVTELSFSEIKNRYYFASFIKTDGFSRGEVTVNVISKQIAYDVYSELNFLSDLEIDEVIKDGCITYTALNPVSNLSMHEFQLQSSCPDSEYASFLIGWFDIGENLVRISGNVDHSFPNFDYKSSISTQEINNIFSSFKTE